MVLVDGRRTGLREKWRGDIPVLYDFFLSHHTTWPTLPCRWGSMVAEHKTYAEQGIFLSEQTDGTAPNTLIVATAAVPYANETRPEQLLEDWDEEAPSEMIGVSKTIFHPGEVNRIRELPQHPHIVATHTDAPEVLVWNTESQVDKLPPGAIPKKNEELSAPDLVLAGHEDNAEFALATSNAGPFILSGGRDTNVALWCLEDNVDHAESKLSPEGSAATITARALYKGHRDTVEDVAFQPNRPDQFCSVGDDHCLLIWDSKSSKAPSIRVDRAHKKDVQCVDWSPHNEHHIITGSADCTARLFDTRKLATKGHSPPVHSFGNMHTDAVVSVEWCPQMDGVFATAGDDGVINIVNSKVALSSSASEKAKMGREGVAQGIILKHLGHRDKISDLHWNPHNPWTLLSCSIDTGKIGGGTVQVWRPTDLLYEPPEKMLSRLMDLQD